MTALSKRNLLGIVLLAIPYCSFAQESYQATYLKNDPDKIKAVTFLIEGYTEGWNTNPIWVGGIIGADFYFGKHVDLSFQDRNSLYSKYLLDNSFQHGYNYQELVAEYNLTARYKNRSYSVITTTYQDGSYEYVTPTLLRRTSVALRGGFIHIGTTYDQSQVKANANGVPLTGQNYMNLEPAVIGFSIKNIHYGVIKLNGNKPRTEGECAEYYVDLLPLLSSQIPDNVSYLSMLGYRAGIKITSISTYPGLSIGLEFGARPGPGTTDMKVQSYAMLSLGLSFSTREKF